MAINDELLDDVYKFCDVYDINFEDTMQAMNDMAQTVNKLWSGDPLDGDEAEDFAQVFKHFLLMWNGNE